LVLATALLCLGPTGCHSYRALPDAALAEANGATFAQRDVEAIADDYLSALLEYHPELGTRYSLPDARHDRLTDNSPEARIAWQAREDAWLAELRIRGMPAEVGSRDWVTYGILHETLVGSAGIRICRNELWAASSMTGWHTSVPGLFEIQPSIPLDCSRRCSDWLRCQVHRRDRQLRRGLNPATAPPDCGSCREQSGLAGADGRC
jgi:hypothetical protein